MADSNHALHTVGEMFSGANTSMPASEKRGFTPGNVQLPTSTPQQPTTPKAPSNIVEGGFTPTNVIMPSEPKPRRSKSG